MEKITPKQIEAAAYASRLTMAEVCRRADVAASTFWRASKGLQKLRPVTAAKLMDAAKDNGGAL